MKGEDVLGSAIYDYYKSSSKGDLIIHSTYGEPEIMPVETYFRTWDEFSDLEQFALGLCGSTILDMGAGAGCHSLYLQESGRIVYSIDRSMLCCKAMVEQGIENVINKSWQDGDFPSVDTILCLMNGVGLAGSISEFRTFIASLKRYITSNGGRIIIESSDISYLDQKPHSSYYGEVKFQFEYNSRRGDWFNWVYIDEDKFLELCTEFGFNCQIAASDETGAFIAVVW